MQTFNNIKSKHALIFVKVIINYKDYLRSNVRQRFTGFRRCTSSNFFPLFFLVHISNKTYYFYMYVFYINKKVVLNDDY